MLGEGGGGIECDWDASDSFPGWGARGGGGVGGALVRESCNDGEGGGGGAGEFEAEEGVHGVVIGGGGAVFSLGLLVGIMCANTFGISSNLLPSPILPSSSLWPWYSLASLQAAWLSGSWMSACVSSSTSKSSMISSLSLNETNFFNLARFTKFGDRIVAVLLFLA